MMDTRIKFVKCNLALLIGLCGACGDDDASGGGTEAATSADGGSTSATTDGMTGTSVASSTSSGSADETADGTTQGEPPPPSADCVEGTSIDQAGDSAPSGVERCDDGLLHRLEAVSCAVPSPPEPTCDPNDACQSHADCTEQADGFCLDTDDLLVGCECVYPDCATDADCDDGSLCLCARGEEQSPLPLVPACIPGTCRTDADCGEGLCAIQASLAFCGPTAYNVACLTEDSECRDFSSCSELVCDFDDSTYSETCRISDGDWVCADPGCDPGGCG